MTHLRFTASLVLAGAWLRVRHADAWSELVATSRALNLELAHLDRDQSQTRHNEDRATISARGHAA